MVVREIPAVVGRVVVAEGNRMVVNGGEDYVEDWWKEFAEELSDGEQEWSTEEEEELDSLGDFLNIGEGGYEWDYEMGGGVYYDHRLSDWEWDSWNEISKHLPFHNLWGGDYLFWLKYDHYLF